MARKNTPLLLHIVIPMTTRDLLSLTQWLSPAFPVGGFSYSHGLDWAVGAQEVNDSASFARWLEDCLVFGAGHNDGVLLSLAFRAAIPLEDLGNIAAALAASRERWQETLAQGRAFETLSGALSAQSARDLPLPLAVGARARALDLPLETVVALYLQNFASNLCTIATRLIPIGQTDGQIVLDALAPVIAEMAQELLNVDVTDLASSVPRGDLAAMRHETQDVRLYQS